MRVLVTGASGFIGSCLVSRLRAEGVWTRAVDIRPAVSLDGPGDALRLDLRDAASAAQACGGGIDRVFHFAADHGGAGYFYSDRDFRAANNNLTIDRNILAASMKFDVDRLFFASSACTYPVAIQDGAARALRESDLGRGEGEQLYGRAKRMSTLLMEGAREHGFDARSGVFHTIYGPGQEYLEPRAKFPTALCRKIIENPERVEVWGDGTQVRTFLFIDDALDRICTVMDEPYHGPVNVGSDEPVTVRECCDWTAEHAGVNPEWVWTAGPTGVAHRAADNTEWDRRYGYTPLVSARDGFVRTYDWLQEEMALADAA